MFISIIIGSIILTALGLCAYAAWSDIRTLTIPNFVPISLCLLFLGAVIIQEVLLTQSLFYSSLSQQLFATLLVFTVTALLFTFNIFGAGDAKLLTSLTLWTGFQGLSTMIFWMAVFGGLLAFTAIIIKRYKPFSHLTRGSWLEQLQRGRNAVPYGLAIFAGFLIACAQIGYFHHTLWVS